MLMTHKIPEKLILSQAIKMMSNGSSSSHRANQPLPSVEPSASHILHQRQYLILYFLAAQAEVAYMLSVGTLCVWGQGNGLSCRWNGEPQDISENREEENKIKAGASNLIHRILLSLSTKETIWTEYSAFLTDQTGILYVIRELMWSKGKTRRSVVSTCEWVCTMHVSNISIFLGQWVTQFFFLDDLGQICLEIKQRLKNFPQC